MSESSSATPIPAPAKPVVFTADENKELTLRRAKAAYDVLTAIAAKQAPLTPEERKKGVEAQMQYEEEQMRDVAIKMSWQLECGFRTPEQQRETVKELVRSCTGLDDYNPEKDPREERMRELFRRAKEAKTVATAIGEELSREEEEDEQDEDWVGESLAEFAKAIGSPGAIEALNLGSGIITGIQNRKGKCCVQYKQIRQTSQAMGGAEIATAGEITLVKRAHSAPPKKTVAFAPLAAEAWKGRQLSELAKYLGCESSWKNLPSADFININSSVVPDGAITGITNSGTTNFVEYRKVTDGQIACVAFNQGGPVNVTLG